MPASPKVSILLPTGDGVAALRRAVDSVRRQTCLDWELIVIDDGATGHATADTAAWLATLRDERIHLLQQDQAGIGRARHARHARHARNPGLRAARGQYIAVLDADTEWSPHFLALTVAFLDAHAQQMFVATELHVTGPLGGPGGVRAAGEPWRCGGRSEAVGAWGQRIVHRLGRPAARVHLGAFLPPPRRDEPSWLPVTLLRREALATVGGFGAATGRSADQRFLARLCRHFPAALIAVPGAHCAERRRVAEPLGAGAAHVLIRFVRLMRRALAGTVAA